MRLFQLEWATFLLDDWAIAADLLQNLETQNLEKLNKRNGFRVFESFEILNLRDFVF